MRKRQRVASLEKPILAQVSTCPACGAAVRSHRACPQCGTYKGRKVVAVAAE
jgi:large subunit ribosomal protein L32